MLLKYLRLTLELTGVSLIIVFAYLWYANSSPSYEPIIVVITALLLVLETLYRNKPSSKNLSNSDLIKHKEKLRKKFKEKILECRHKDLNKDAIIRDIKRNSQYPESIDKKGISPWFRVALLDTYHDGIMVGLYWETIDIEHEEFDKTTIEKIRAILVGDIPFEHIEEVNIDGDEYYQYPHIFCHFSFNKEPYKRLYYCEEIMQNNNHPFYKEIIAYSDLKK